MPSTLYLETSDALKTIQKFDPNKLIRHDELGGQLSFEAAVIPAQRIIDFFSQIQTLHLSELSDAQLGVIKSLVTNTLDLFNAILSFSAQSTNPADTRNQLLENLQRSYNQIFDSLFTCVAYINSKANDVGSLRASTTELIESIKDQAANLTRQLTSDKVEAEKTLTAIREVAAEQGVSQQAIYFKDEARHHQKLAVKWRWSTLATAVALITFATLSMFFHKLEWLKPETTYETAQLALSKFLTFSVIAYMLILCARNFMSHKHNEIVNRHRQNALLTFKALATAANSDDQRDIVLAHAAACIFAPQETGYTKSSSSNDASPMKIIEVAQKAAPHS